MVIKIAKKKKLQTVKSFWILSDKKTKLIKTKKDFFKYYLCPIYFSRRKNISIINIHKQICQYFSLEKFSDLIQRYKELSYEKFEKLFNNKAVNINFNSVSNKQLLSKDRLVQQIFHKK